MVLQEHAAGVRCYRGFYVTTAVHLLAVYSQYNITWMDTQLAPLVTTLERIVTFDP